jgi:hypothetical protein
MRMVKNKSTLLSFSKRGKREDKEWIGNEEGASINCSYNYFTKRKKPHT